MIGGIERIVRVELVIRIGRVVRVKPIDWIEGVVGGKPIRRVQGIVRGVLVSRIEDVIVAFILRIKACLSICRYRNGEQDHRKKCRSFGIHRAMIPKLQGMAGGDFSQEGKRTYLVSRGHPLPEPPPGSISRA